MAPLRQQNTFKYVVIVFEFACFLAYACHCRVFWNSADVTATRPAQPTQANSSAKTDLKINIFEFS
jgi:hypothetical protein